MSVFPAHECYLVMVAAKTFDASADGYVRAEGAAWSC